MSQYLVATVAGQRVALDAVAVESVIDIGELTPVPIAPPHIAGLCAVRSLVLTVVDVAAAIGLDAEAGSGRAAVISHDGHRYALRMARVDEVIGTEAPPRDVDASIGPGWHAVADGRVDIGDGFALLLDPARIVAAAGANAVKRQLD